MRIVDINTNKIIEKTEYCPQGIFWTIPEHWKEYKEWCKFMEEKQSKIFFTKPILNEEYDTYHGGLL
jgi:hypothetical protein